MARNLTEEEKAAWQEEARHIKKISRKKLAPIEVATPKATTAATREYKFTHSHAIASQQRIINQPFLEEGAFAGVDAGTVKRMKRGQLAVSARIDLHGMTQEEAYQALCGFIDSAASQRKKLVLVITGKGRVGQGGGVLKTMLPKWLNSDVLRPHILAFDTAQIQHGGSGAFYVLLKRNRL